MIQKLQKMDEQTLDLTDFFPASRRDASEMLQELGTLASMLTNPHLKALCESFLSDDEIVRLLKIAPAAKSMHHAYLGGLLDHILSMGTLARQIAAHYQADLDLLFTGVLLHDIGKIYELSYDRSFGYTVDGHLLGHMHIGIRMLNEKIGTLAEFPEKLRVLIEHMILSHHGALEYGSPKTPAFVEALLLHHLDNLDSKMDAMRCSLEKDRSLEGCFTGYNAALDRQVFRTDRYLNPPSPGQPSNAKAPPAQRSEGPARAENDSRKPPPLSPFGARLQQALSHGKKD
jgi:3'-5' exoribonuclease